MAPPNQTAAVASSSPPSITTSIDPLPITRIYFPPPPRTIGPRQASSRLFEIGVRVIFYGLALPRLYRPGLFRTLLLPLSHSLSNLSPPSPPIFLTFARLKSPQPSQQPQQPRALQLIPSTELPPSRPFFRPRLQQHFFSSIQPTLLQRTVTPTRCCL